MDPNKFKADFRDLFDKVSTSPDPMAELTRLQQFVGNRDHEAMAQQAGQMKQQFDQLKGTHEKTINKLWWSRLITKTLATTAVGLALFSGYEVVKGKDVVVLDSSAAVDLIPASATDAEALNETFRTQAQYFHPMQVVAADGAPVHPEIPSTVPAAYIAPGSCAYVYSTLQKSTDGRDYAQVMMRLNGVTSKGYIAAQRLKPAQIDMGQAQPCKATPLTAPKP